MVVLWDGEAEEEEEDDGEDRGVKSLVVTAL